MVMYMEDIEVWKSVSDYDNYEVSSFGHVRNKKTGRSSRDYLFATGNT